MTETFFVNTMYINRLIIFFFFILSVDISVFRENFLGFEFCYVCVLISNYNLQTTKVMAP